MSASAFTPATCCSAAASTPTAAFAASRSTSPRAWSRPRRPGALRISHDTYAQVRGLFEVERQEPLAVKGVDEPIQSYLVLRAKPRSFRLGTRGIEGVATRMIGRDAELEALQDAFKRLFADRKLAAVTVVADAGIGKSRLLYEFAAWSDARPETLLSSSAAAPRRRRKASPSDCCATSSPGASRSPTTTASRRRAGRWSRASSRCSWTTTAPTRREGHAHLLGHLIGIEWRESRACQGHPRRPEADPQPRLPRRGAAVPAHRRRRRHHPSSCSSKTCTGPTTRAWTSSPTWPRSIATCRC